MLKLTIPATEQWDEQNQEFVYGKETTLQLEHSLVSLSKWESKWKKPFLNCNLTVEETIDYIRCMTLTQNVPPEVYQKLTSKNISDVRQYVAESMTATKPKKDDTPKRSREPVTAEILYSDMINLGIPFECQKWHLSRLITLIRVCDLRNRQPKKLSPGELRKRNAALNASRRKQWNTKG